MALDHDLYLISMAARMLGMHPQTLRKYERLGLVQPTRTLGSMRLYSRDELERLKVIKRLVDDGGINLAGVQRLMSIAEIVERIRPLMHDEALSGRDAVIHLAGEPVAQRWNAAVRERIRSSRVDGTRNLVTGLRTADPRPGVLVSASAVGVSTTR